MPKTIERRTSPVIVRMTKSQLPAPQLCKVNPWSGCNALVTDKHRRGVCDSCYQSIYDMVWKGTASWEEFESAGMVNPRRRQLQKRVLSVIVARRTA